MKLSKKKKAELKDLTADVFIKGINEQSPHTIDRHPDEWDWDDKRLWDMWGTMINGLDERIIEIVEGEKKDANK